MPNTLTNLNRSQKINSIIRGFRMFIRSSWLSLLFIGIIVVLISQMDQGAGLLVHLLDHNPINLLLFLILVHAFSIVVSHYPTYLQTWNISKYRKEEGHIDGMKWFLTKYNFLGFGIVTFRFNKEKTYVERISVSLRRLLGIALHFSIIYILMVVYDKYIQEIPVWIWGLAIGIAIGISILYRKIEKVFPDLSQEKIKKLSKIASAMLWLNVLLSLVLIVVSHIYGWSRITFGLFILEEILSIGGFILFRNLRLLIRGRNIRVFPLSLISTHQNYLLMISVVGWLSLGIVIIANIKVFAISPMTLILAYIYLIYGLIILPIKHYFYYSSTTDAVNSITKRFVLRVTPLMFVAVVGYTYFSGVVGNGLHLIPEVLQSETEVLGEDQFIDNLHTQKNISRDKFYIASYGGGLKANYWNLLILDSLSNFNGQNIIGNTIAMSGVSGGSLGQAFYSALYKRKQHEPDALKRCADEIGKHNFLSIDIAYTLGWDFIREQLITKSKFASPDRAGLAMMKYADIIGDQDMLKMSYQAYWKTIYDQFNHYPVLLTNSTGIHLKRGIGCSIHLNDFKVAFPSAVDILNLDGNLGVTHKSLTYSGAVSCTNRFPILSPTARVRGKGNFLDGGYFDNSGMLSLLDFHRYLEKKDRHYEQLGNKIFIQIVNSKTEYLRSVLRDRVGDVKYRENETGELRAILDVATSIEMLPRYIESYFERDGLTYVQIHLPYELSMEDVDNLIGGELLPKDKRVINEILEKNNAWLRGVILASHSRWEVSEPPLARLIGEQSMNYMHAIIADGSIFDRLKSVVESTDN